MDRGASTRTDRAPAPSCLVPRIRSVESMNPDAISTAARPAERAANETSNENLRGLRGPKKNPSRDASIDLIRSLCLVLVVVLHSLMVGVSVGPAGPIMANALDSQPWFAPATWLVQVMPLFFIAGGFSSITQWHSVSARGGSAADYARTRLLRLLIPSVLMVGLVGVGLVMFTMAGVPADVVSTAGLHISQPLWFLAVYLGCSALVPFMAHIHRKARISTTIGLLFALVLIDALRILTDQTAVGYVNLVFVWLFIQQLGFWLADGSLDRMLTATKRWIAGIALALLLGLVISGWYSGDMYVNMNPPTGALALLAIAQLMVFSLCQSNIRRWAENLMVIRLVQAVGSRAMTIYLWHMPVLVVLAGLLLVLPLHLPAPGSAEWWMTRPIWLATTACVLVPTACIFGRLEGARNAPERRPSSGGSVAFSSGLGILGVILLLVDGITAMTAAISVLLFSCALIGHTSIRQLRPRR